MMSDAVPVSLMDIQGKKCFGRKKKAPNLQWIPKMVPPAISDIDSPPNIDQVLSLSEGAVSASKDLRGNALDVSTAYTFHPQSSSPSPVPCLAVSAPLTPTMSNFEVDPMEWLPW